MSGRRRHGRGLTARRPESRSFFLLGLVAFIQPQDDDEQPPPPLPAPTAATCIANAHKNIDIRHDHPICLCRDQTRRRSLRRVGFYACSLLRDELATAESDASDAEHSPLLFVVVVQTNCQPSPQARQGVGRTQRGRRRRIIVGDVRFLHQSQFGHSLFRQWQRR